jgi:hypothetical protein
MCLRADPAMPTDTEHEKQQVHELIDRLAPSQLTAVHGLLDVMIDPVGHAIANAPIDDEPETDEEKRAVAEAQDWLKKSGGKGLAHEEAMRRLGLD